MCVRVRSTAGTRKKAAAAATPLHDDNGTQLATRERSPPYVISTAWVGREAMVMVFPGGREGGRLLLRDSSCSHDVATPLSIDYKPQHRAPLGHP